MRCSIITKHLSHPLSNQVEFWIIIRIKELTLAIVDISIGEATQGCQFSVDIISLGTIYLGDYEGKGSDKPGLHIWALLTYIL